MFFKTKGRASHGEYHSRSSVAVFRLGHLPGSAPAAQPGRDELADPSGGEPDDAPPTRTPAGGELGPPVDGVVDMRSARHEELPGLVAADV